MGKTQNVSQEEPALTVALETPSARVLAHQASVIQDLEFVMDCCKRLLTELGQPEDDRDTVAALALWSSAVLAYARCFGENGLTAEDVRKLPLQGAVATFHDWILGERDRLTEHPANPFDAAKVGAALAPAGHKERKVEGIAVFSASRVLVDITGVRQLGGLASELAKRTAGKAQKQQDSVLSDAQQADIGTLYDSPPLLPRGPVDSKD